MKPLIRKILHSGLPMPSFLKPLVRALYRAGVVLAEGLPVLRKWFWIEPVLRSICASVGRGLRVECMPYIRGRGRLTIGDNVHLSGRISISFMSGMPASPEIVIGNNVFIGSGSILSAGRGIRIGNNVLVSAGVRIHDNDGHPMSAERRIAGERIQPDDAKEVAIEDNAWIGASAIILKGVRIGRNAIVGAGAVVTRDVPAESVVAGNPATVVKSS